MAIFKQDFPGKQYGDRDVSIDNNSKEQKLSRFSRNDISFENTVEVRHDKTIEKIKQYYME